MADCEQSSNACERLILPETCLWTLIPILYLDRNRGLIRPLSNEIKFHSIPRQLLCLQKLPTMFRQDDQSK